jgi:hypothetical protein
MFSASVLVGLTEPSWLLLRIACDFLVLDAALFCNVLKFLLFVALSTRCSGVCDPFDIVPCVSLSCWGCLRLIACPVFDAPRPMRETPLSFSASVLSV